VDSGRAGNGVSASARGLPGTLPGAGGRSRGGPHSSAMRSARRSGGVPQLEDYLRRFPQWAPEIRIQFEWSVPWKGTNRWRTRVFTPAIADTDGQRTAPRICRWCQASRYWANRAWGHGPSLQGAPGQSGPLVALKMIASEPSPARGMAASREAEAIAIANPKHRADL